ncbi:hypothetical protein [Fusobacterium polymorphum]|uniref:Uncharacterized protein n=1 Tax=Fusobacterium nucleatum subsp. polymorphum TaxID=76857 RepID=A0A2C6BK88_FUSNP|nr:hypothetical protein [Fusobacterium polymorphum]PHI06018.1 hypothetical protein CBG54_02630 [Fusobacterium polymorphum]
MQEKRKGYKTQEQQNKANQRYRATEKGKKNDKYSTYKSRAKVFIKTMASINELEELIEMIEKEKESLKMKKIWKEVKNLVKEMNIDNDNIDKTSGECIVDLIGGKYNGWSVAGKVNLDGDYKEITIDDNAVVYNPAE